MKTRFPSALLAAVLGLGWGAAVALAQPVQEQEPNNDLGAPQKLISADGPVDVDAAMGVVGGTVDDLDFYTLSLKAGDVVTVDANGLGGAQSVRLFVAMFKPAAAPLGAALAAVPSGYTVDRVAQGSTTQDPKIENYVVAQSGKYVIGICSWPRYFDADGTLQRPQFYTNGDYDLLVTGASTSVLQIPIAIKPGSGEMAPFNPKAKGKIPVALLSSDGFKPLEVDPSSLRFGAEGDEDSLVSCAGGKGKGGLQGEDLNGDGTPDLVCHFDSPACRFGPGSLEGILTGTTDDGTPFEGRGWLKIVPPR